MKKTVVLIANMLKEKFDADNVKNLQPEASLAYLPRFFEKIFVAKDMIQVFSQEHKKGNQDEFTIKIVDFLEKASNPHGRRVDRLIWKEITVDEIITWVEKNETTEDLTFFNITFFKRCEDLKSDKGWSDKKIIETIFVYPFITDNYKILCAIIDEHK